MSKPDKPSTLGEQVKSAQRSMKTWPEWMREAAKFAGQPRQTQEKTGAQEGASGTVKKGGS